MAKLKKSSGNPEDFFYALSLRGEAEAIQKMFVQSLDCHDFLRSLAVTGILHVIASEAEAIQEVNAG